jgi:uncharacterized ion transporter superfamily protein YfcC
LNMTNKKRWSLDSLVLIFSIVVLAQVLTYIVPQGKFDREQVPDSPKTMVVAGSYERLAEDQQTTLWPWHCLMAIPKGLEAAMDIIFLVFLVGGVIKILRATGAIDAALHAAVSRLGTKPWILIAGCLLMFSLGAFTIGMGEEYVPLIPILVTMSLAMKMDAIVAMGMVWVPYGIGWASAAFNPFGVVIAKDIAGVPLESGTGFRFIMLAVFLLIAFQHVYAYARRIRKDPSKSLVAHIDYSTGFDPPSDIKFNAARAVILLVFLAGVIGFVFGAKYDGWYINELNAVFLGIGLIAAAIARMAPSVTSRNFIEGAAEMTSAALLIGVARAIQVVLDDGQIADTVIHGIASMLDGSSAEVAAVGMLAVQTVCNFFIPSGSGQAYVTMPIMSPLAELTQVPQETAVLAYQFGDGFTNMVVPTSALVMGTLALGKIPYGAWVRFVMPLLAKLFTAAIIFLIISVSLFAPQ